MANLYFSGQGKLFFALRDGSGVPQGYTDLGNVSALTMRLGKGYAQYAASAAPVNFTVGFGTGSQTVYQLPVLTGNTPQNPTLYKTDWQGKQLLYTTPRTNLLLQASTLATSPWVPGQTGVAAAPTVTNAFIAGPDGVAASASKIAFPGITGTDTSFVRQNVAGLTNPTTLSPSAWIKGDAPATLLMRQGNGAAGFSTINITTAWQRLNPPSGVNAATSFNFDFAQVTGGTTTAFNAYVAYSQLESGSVITPAIQTTTAAVTVTDYTIDAANNITYSPAPLAGALLNGTGTQLTLPPAIRASDPPQFDIAMESWNPANIAIAMYGASNTIAGATVANEVITARAGLTVPLANINLASFTSLKNSGNTVTYVLNTDYQINLAMGSITFPSGSAITDGQSLNANYVSSAYSKISAGTVTPGFMWLRLEGLNTANFNSAVVVDLFKTRLYPVEQTDLLSDRFEQLILHGRLFNDYAQTLNTTDGQLFRIRQA